MKTVKLELTKEDKATLCSWSNSHKTEQRYAFRSAVILKLSEGLTYKQIREKLNTNDQTISKWKQRFIKKGINGLYDLPRSGTPRTYDDTVRMRIVELACSNPKGGYTNWSHKRIAKEVGVSTYVVWDVLNNNKLKPHKVEYWCGKSTDPEFEEKMMNIIGLYLNPPTNALVLSVDEKTQIQALDRTRPLLPMRSNKPRRLTSTYKRNGVVSLMAALSVHEGEITARTIDSNNTENFLAFLKYLDRKYRHVHLHIIVDNLSVHKNKKVKEWLKHKRKVTLHFTPTYSSWLNQIEIWFGILTKDVLRGGVWQSKKQLVRQLMDYIKTYNKERAKPFNWTYGGTK